MLQWSEPFIFCWVQSAIWDWGFLTKSLHKRHSTTNNALDCKCIQNICKYYAGYTIKASYPFNRCYIVLILRIINKITITYLRTLSDTTPCMGVPTRMGFCSCVCWFLRISDYTKGSVGSHSYMTGATTAMLQRSMPNMWKRYVTREPLKFRWYYSL